MHLFCFLIIVLSLHGAIESYSILGLFPFPGASHYVMFEALLKALAEKGHEVDVLSHFPQNEPIARFKDLSMKGTMNILRNNAPFPLLLQHFGNRVDMMTFMIEFAGVEYCANALNTTVVQELKNTNKKYDLIITEIYSNDCMLGFGYHFQVPIISMTSSVNVPWGSDRIGNPDNPSYVPNYFLPYTGQMNLIERLDNAITLSLTKLWYSNAQDRNTAIARQFFGEDMPSLQELASNTSLLLVNSHFSITESRPTLPNFVEVGGLHIPPKKHLPKALEDMLNASAENENKGAIYFSMGSMVLTETFPQETLNGLLEAFGELPYQILWKATKEKMPQDLKIPSNIHFEMWFPQSDVLCHPNVKLFVTHGGLMGIQEATFCGVPCLGIPLFADQQMNIKQLVVNGLAVSLSVDNVTTESVLEAAKELLDTPRYKQNAENLAKRFKDRPLAPLDTAVYWVEYVIRHNGAPHLRSSGADLPWYKYHLADVFAILLITIFSIVYIICKSVAIGIRLMMRCFRKGTKIKKE